MVHEGVRGSMTEDSAQQPYDPVRFGQLVEQEDRLFWFRVRNLVIKEAVLPLLAGFSPGYRVLEVGCGTGNVLRTLESICEAGEVIGLEKYDEGVKIARRRVRCEVRQGDVHTLDSMESYQLVGMFDVLEHIENDLKVLEKLRAHLTRDGGLVLTVPANPSLWSEFDVLAHHQRRYTRDSLQTVLKDAGFDVMYITHFMAALLPAMKLKRHNQVSSRNVSPQQVMSENFHPSPLANRIAFGLTWPEIFLIRHRVHIPLGTSLLAVARPHTTAYR